MTFKLKIIFPGLIFMLCFIVPILWAAEIVIPLPTGIVKISEEKNSFGPMGLSSKIYESSLDKNKLESFFKKELAAAGWKENKEWVFIKDNNTLVIMINPAKNEAGKTSLIISTGKIPATEEILAMRKQNPDKLNFMPIYPGSEQVYLWDLSSGMTALYETEANIKDIAFFYKSGMLNYGWSLASETSIKSASIDCPECKKTIPWEVKAAKSDVVGTSNQTTLIFRKGANETCRITIVNVSVDMSNLVEKTQANNEENILLPPSPASNTTISVLYNVYKNIRP